MSILSKRAFTIIALAAGLPLAAFVGGYLYSRQAALSYGAVLIREMAVIPRQSGAHTAALRALLIRPEVARYPARMASIPLLGRGHLELARELEAGLIYLSGELALPVERRFAFPPALSRLRLEPGDRSDQALLEGSSALIRSYLARLRPLVEWPAR